MIVIPCYRSAVLPDELNIQATAYCRLADKYRLGALSRILFN